MCVYIYIYIERWNWNSTFILSGHDYGHEDEAPEPNLLGGDRWAALPLIPFLPPPKSAAKS